MKKILYSILIAGLTLASAACQKVEEKAAKISGDGLKVTATIASFDGTKVNYAFESGAKSAIKPTWSEGDKIFGFDDKGGTFTFTVTSVDTESRRATFEVGEGYEPADGTVVYGVYYPGKTVENFDDGELDVDITSQSGILGDDTPVIMCATATVSDGAISFEFVNQTAIVGIYKMGISESNTTVTGVAIRNVAATGTIKVEDGAIKLVPSGELSRVSATGLTLQSDSECYVTVDPDAIAPYFAVIPCESTMFVDATTDRMTYYNRSSIASSELVAGKYYYIGKELTSPAASVFPTGEATTPEYFGSLEDAVTYANLSDKDVTISLEEDAVIEQQYVTINNANGKVTTLDLNGNTIYMEDENADRVIYATTDLIIEDSREMGGISAPHCAVRANGAKLTINGGNFKGDGYYSGGCGVIYSYGEGSGLTVNGGTITCLASENDGRTLNVTGGDFSLTGGNIICNCATGWAVRLYNTVNMTVNGNAVIYSSGNKNAIYCNNETALATFVSGYVYSDNSEGGIATSGRCSITGGHFNKQVIPVDGYECIENTVTGPDDRTYGWEVVERTSPIAEVNSVSYTQLGAAFDAANAAESDVTVKLLANAGMASGITINNTNSKVTLNLNGKTLASNIIVNTDFEVTGDGTIEAGDHTVQLGTEGAGVEATFTLNGATLKALTGEYAISADGTNNGAQPTVLVKKGTIIGVSNAVRFRYAKSVIFGDETAGDIIVNSVKGFWISYTNNVVVNKGTYVSTERCMYFGNNSSGITINGGTFTSDGCFADYNSATTNPTLIITDGEFSWNSSKPFAQESNTSAKISGGYFTGDVSDHAATGYICVESSEKAGYSYKVVENTDKSIIKVGGVKYESMSEAIAAMNSAISDVTVQFLDNIDLENQIEINNSNAKVTIDLNGKTVKAPNSGSASAIVVEGAATVVDIVDEVGGGMIDHTYANTAYTLTIKSGTVNLISANISNMTGTGYGRNAIRVIAEGSPAYFNMTGGVVRGGRGIRVGGASETARAYVTISGGLVEGRNTDDTNYYSAISTEAGYSNILINGGTIKGNGAKSVVYCNSTNAETSTIIIKNNEVTGTIPYIYSNGCKYAVAAGGSSDKGKLVYTGSWNYYTNNTANSYTGTTLTKEQLDPKIKDEYGNEYTHRCYKNK